MISALPKSDRPHDVDCILPRDELIRVLDRWRRESKLMNREGNQFWLKAGALTEFEPVATPIERALVRLAPAVCDDHIARFRAYRKKAS